MCRKYFIMVINNKKKYFKQYMGNSQSLFKRKINFEDVIYAIHNNSNYLLINVLDYKDQDCLITNTVSCENEETIINNLIATNKKHFNIIVYGLNCNDDKIILKYNDFITLGFYNVYVYCGGMFEWLMLQDIYGNENFPTTSKCHDILKYKPLKGF